MTSLFPKMKNREAASTFKVELIPQPEHQGRFSKRTEEVHELLTKVILLARKRGRPSLKEEQEYEAA